MTLIKTEIRKIKKVLEKFFGQKECIFSTLQINSHSVKPFPYIVGGLVEQLRFQCIPNAYDLQHAILIAKLEILFS